MMRYERYDKLFEEAGRDRQKFDHLLERSKKQRDFAVTILKVIILLCLLLVAWLLYEIWCLVYPFWQALHARQPSVLPTVPAWLKFVSAPHMRLISAMVGMGIYCWVLQFISAMNLANERVKMLLLFRGFRDARKSESSDDISTSEPV